MAGIKRAEGTEQAWLEYTPAQLTTMTLNEVVAAGYEVTIRKIIPITYLDDTTTDDTTEPTTDTAT